MFLQDSPLNQCIAQSMPERIEEKAAVSTVASMHKGGFHPVAQMQLLLLYGLGLHWRAMRRHPV